MFVCVVGGGEGDDAAQSRGFRRMEDAVSRTAWTAFVASWTRFVHVTNRAAVAVTLHDFAMVCAYVCALREPVPVSVPVWKGASLHVTHY